MRRRLTAIVFLSCLAVAVPAATSQARPNVPKGFFGIAPQSLLTVEDARYMRAGGIETVRWPMVWGDIQSTANGGYDWSSLDQTVGTAAQAGLRILPSIGTTPKWLSRKGTTLPINSGKQRSAWVAFLKAAVRRYGPGGQFWRGFGGRAVPIREWQVWNEANFFYFTFPVSAGRYAKLVKLSSKAIKSTKRSAKVILAGLFGEPTARGKRGMPAARFLRQLYRVRGIKRYFDGIALHPYAVNAGKLRQLVIALRRVATANRDRGVGLYVSEMGWGSENNFKKVAFEQGIRGQVKQLRKSYGYLIKNRRRLNLRQVHWFSWKDIQGACSFCDSVGLFREGAGFSPKPAWRAFVAITGGRAQP